MKVDIAHDLHIDILITDYTVMTDTQKTLSFSAILVLAANTVSTLLSIVSGVFYLCEYFVQ